MSFASSQEPPCGARAVSDSKRAWLAWAAAQIDASLTRDRGAMENLVTAVLVIIEELHNAMSLVSTGGRPTSELDRIASHAAAMVVAVQSHDCLAQQLSHVADALRSLAAIAPAPSESDWAALRRRQWQRFSMPEERELFQRMVPDVGGGDRPAASDTCGQPSVELFE